MTKLVADDLMDRAAKSCGLSDYGDLPFREGLEVQLWAMEHESQLPPERLNALTDGIVNLLTKRLKLVDDRKKHPQIEDEVIKAPLIILGLPRTGSTHLHALMATRPNARAPLMWEMNVPSPPPDRETFYSDPRIKMVQSAIESRPDAEEMMKIHPTEATRPEQCIGLIDWSFVNFSVAASGRMPSYFEWFLNADHRAAYEHHHRMMQHLQWKVPGEWVLKYPKHVFSLYALLETYPDARIIWTHRDPAKVLASVCNFVGSIRKSLDPQFNAQRFGREWVAIEEMGLSRAMNVRHQLNDEKRFYDVHFQDLMSDPVKTVTGIYKYFDIPVDSETEANIANYQSENPKDKHGKHEYTPETYGLTIDHLRERFSAYSERFNVQSEFPQK